MSIVLNIHLFNVYYIQRKTHWAPPNIQIIRYQWGEPQKKWYRDTDSSLHGHNINTARTCSPIRDYIEGITNTLRCIQSLLWHGDTINRRNNPQNWPWKIFRPKKKKKRKKIDPKSNRNTMKMAEWKDGAFSRPCRILHTQFIWQ